MEIKKLNKNYNQLDWDELQFDYWEVFNPPVSVSATEMRLAMDLKDMMKLDGQEEYLITFRATPAHFGELIINFMRMIQTKYPGSFTGEIGEEE
jgi:hypothetical protein